MRSSRCDPVFSGVPRPRRNSGDVPDALRASIRSTVVVGLRPRRLLGRPEDRTERDLEAQRRLPTGGPRRLADRGDLVGRLGERLAPQAEDVGDRRARGIGRRRRAAEGHVGPRLPDGEDVADEVLERVVLAAVVERRVLGPHALHDLDVLTGPRVALVLVQSITFPPLLVVVATGDEVHGDAAVADLVDRGERLRRVRRDRQVGAMGQQQLQRGRLGGDVRRRGGRVRRAAAVGEQHPVPAVVLVGAGEALGVVLVEARPGAGVGLRSVVGRRDPEELDGHGGAPFCASRSAIPIATVDIPDSGARHAARCQTETDNDAAGVPRSAAPLRSSGTSSSPHSSTSRSGSKPRIRNFVTPRS